MSVSDLISHSEPCERTDCFWHAPECNTNFVHPYLVEYRYSAHHSLHNISATADLGDHTNGVVLKVLAFVWVMWDFTDGAVLTWLGLNKYCKQLMSQSETDLKCLITAH